MTDDLGGRTDGVLLVDKPRGPTSHDVVARVRRALRTREVGHAGTLDPMATGVLVVLVGEATKLAAYLTADDKAYEATVVFGTETASFDADGEVVRHVDVPSDVRAAVASIAADLGGGALGRGEPPPVPLARSGAPEAIDLRDARGPLQAALAAEASRVVQVPPAVSAIKVAGVRSYQRAARGEVPPLAERRVAVRAMRVLGATVEPLTLRLELVVTKGYYVRAFARDLAEGLGTVGHLSALRRTRSGAFHLARAVPVDAAPDTLRDRLLPVAEAAVRTLPAKTLTARGVIDARAGRVVRAEDREAPPSVYGAAPDVHVARSDGAPTEIAASGAPPAPALDAEPVEAWLDPGGRLVALGRAGRVVRGFRGA